MDIQAEMQKRVQQLLDEIKNPVLTPDEQKEVNVTLERELFNELRRRHGDIPMEDFVDELLKRANSTTMQDQVKSFVKNKN